MYPDGCGIRLKFVATDIRLDQPDPPIVIIVNKFLIASLIHVASPYDFRFINVRGVKDPFIQRIVSGRISDDDKVLSR